VYAFRGADYRNILKFESDFPGCTVIKLEQNYRSTSHILEGAHQIITKNKLRSDKKLWTDLGEGKPIQVMNLANERMEAEAIVKMVKELKSKGDISTFNEVAVLYRTNAQSRAIEEVFLQYALPYKIVGGVRFYDRKEIKDLIAYLRFIYQPADRVSFMRIVNIPTRGLGDVSVQKFLLWAESNALNIADALLSADQCTDITPRARKSLSELGSIHADFRNYLDELLPSELITKLIARLKYLDFLDDKTPQGEARQENVKELLTVAKSFDTIGLANLLEEVSLISDLDGLNEDQDAVTMMTVHASKGLEFPVVFVAGMEESIFPHSRSLYDPAEMEEERRLCYVAMTRAKKHLYLLSAVTRSLYGSLGYNPVSRFIKELKTSEVSAPNAGSAVAQNNTTYDEGDGVKHALYGAGRVIEVSGDQVVVNFFGKGIKVMNIAFAPLEKLPDML
jgi:DNA helicase II / ATP-dependent DNA helicase PcrA